MKRKIAAIFAADIAGYSRLVAEDEEETLRRLASYRLVTDDFIAKGGGRIFNTAGDAVLAEFPSAVEAVRCAIDIQESLRTRNMAYPPSRQMSFRIGITIGDVVERDGDLLGDGVNIAARLEGLAEVGGICISRAVHEQVANKLSVQFADIGAQEVKNIPTPVHAYMVAMRREDGTYATPQVKKPIKAAAAPNWMWPVAVTLVCLVAIGVGGFLYFTKLETRDAQGARPHRLRPAAHRDAPRPHHRPLRHQRRRWPLLHRHLRRRRFRRAKDLSPRRCRSSATRRASSSRTNMSLRPTHKAFALNINGIIGLASGQPSEEAAKSAALEQCQKRADVGAVAAEMRALCRRRHGGLPAWQAAGAAAAVDQARPVDRAAVRGRGHAVRARSGQGEARKQLCAGRKRARRSRSARAGHIHFLYRRRNGRRRRCAGRSKPAARSPVLPAWSWRSTMSSSFRCRPRMKATGFFRAADNSLIATDASADVARQLADAASGWNAVAVGAAGRPGLALKAATEQNAVNEALGNCVKHDSDCHVIAIGPFAVGPN